MNAPAGFEIQKRGNYSIEICVRYTYRRVKFQSCGMSFLFLVLMMRIYNEWQLIWGNTAIRSRELLPGGWGSDPCQKNGGFIWRNIAITLSGDPKQPCYLFQELSEC